MNMDELQVKVEAELRKVAAELGLEIDVISLGHNEWNVYGHLMLVGGKVSELPKICQRDLTMLKHYFDDNNVWENPPANDFEFWIKRHLMRVKFNNFPNYRAEFERKQAELNEKVAVDRSQAMRDALVKMIEDFDFDEVAA